MKIRSVTGLMLIISAVLMSFLWSCNNESVEPDEFDTSYFPLEVGSYIIYELDSTVWDDFNEVINERTLQVRELVESIFIDASGDESFRIERQYRDDENSSWGSAGYDIWSAYIDENNAIRTEENQRYIKIAFPVRLGKTWQGNAQINVDPNGPLSYLVDWEYRIATLDEPMSLNDLEFDSTMTVIQAMMGTAIDTIGSRAVYAKHVGEIYRELWVLESQCDSCAPSDIICIQECQQSPWEIKAEKGFIVRQTIMEYGTL